MIASALNLSVFSPARSFLPGALPWSLPRFLPRVLVLLLLVPLSAGCSSEASDTAQGYIEGEHVYVASPNGGRLETLTAQRGRIIEAKTPLFRLEAVEERTALEQAEQQLAAEAARLADMSQGKRPDELEVLRAQLARAKAAEGRSARQRRRDEAQFKTGAISQAQLEQSRATHEADAALVRELAAQLAVGHLPARADQLRAQEAALASALAGREKARWRLAEKEPSAPMRALVVDTLYRVGEWVPPGSPVVKLLPPGHVKVRFFVPEPVLSRISLGQKVRVRLDGRDDAVPCSVTYVGNEAEYTPPVIYSNETREKLVFLIEAHPDPEAAALLHPGQPVAVMLP